MTREPIRPILIGLAIVVLLIVVLSVVSCHSRRDETAQAEQTVASGEALSNAADMAVDTITNRTATETDIDRATVVAQLEIGNAADAGDVRDAVVDALCMRAEHSLDPACRVP